MLGLNLLLSELVATGGTVAVELPTYDRTLKALHTAGAELVAVARGTGVDDQAKLALLLHDGEGERAEALVRAHLRRACELLIGGLNDARPAEVDPT